MSFRNYLSEEQFSQCVREVSSSEPTKERSVYQDLFFQALTSFLSDMQKNGHSFFINNSAGHYTPLTDKWPQALSTPHAQRAVEDIFFPLYIMYALKPEHKTEGELYESLVAVLDNGQIRSHCINQGMQCADCGQKFQLNIKNWQPQFQVFGQKEDGSLDYRNLVPPKKCLPKESVQVEIDFPTGEVLVCDWFRIQEFNEIVKDENQYEDYASINHAAGRIYTTKRYAQLFNLVCVSVGNSSPNIFLDTTTGSLTVGEERDEDLRLDSRFKDVAQVCTDFWGVSLIDKAELVRVLSQKYPDRAQQLVDDYIRAPHNNMQIIHITPGTYTLDFHGNYHQFKNMAESSPSITPLFMLRASHLRKKLSL